MIREPHEAGKPVGPFGDEYDSLEAWDDDALQRTREDLSEQIYLLMDKRWAVSEEIGRRVMKRAIVVD